MRSRLPLPAVQWLGAVLQFACGNMLRKGEGAAQNHTEALRYFRLAAAQNNTRALNGLGIAYLHGHGDVEQVGGSVWELEGEGGECHPRRRAAGSPLRLRGDGLHVRRT